MRKIDVAVIGLGHWGPNLVRNIAASQNMTLHTVCDSDPFRLKEVSRQYPEAKPQTDFEAILADPQVDAVIISTPVSTHFKFASESLQAGKHVLVEKPLARTSEQCRELITLSERNSRVLMVGHVFLYNSAVRKVKEYIDTGSLGDIYYVYSQRLNLGIVRQDVNALWNFAPHDISILNYWLGQSADNVLARGFSYIQPDIEDVVFMTLNFPDGVGANVHLSWLDPNKIRRMTVVGSKKMIVYDDVSTDAQIMIFDKNITGVSQNQRSVEPYQSFEEFKLIVRSGDVLIPNLKITEPLKVECEHFAECIQTGLQPVTDGYNGLQVVKTLEAAQLSMSSNASKQ